VAFNNIVDNLPKASSELILVLILIRIDSIISIGFLFSEKLINAHGCSLHYCKSGPARVVLVRMVEQSVMSRTFII
jgi:hypothetical protein